MKAGEVESAQPVITLSDSTLDFGNVSLDSTAVKSVTITNTGTALLTISWMQLSGSDQDYSVPGGLGGFTLEPNHNKVIGVNFKPVSTGYKLAQLTFVDDKGTHVSVNLSGTGIEPEHGELSLSSLSCDFGDIEVNESKDTSITLYNTGNGRLTIDSIYLSGTDKEDFSFGNLTFPVKINSGSSTSLGISFNPSATGIKNANLIIAYNSGMTALVSLSGTSIISGVEDLPGELSYKIFPNPAKDVLRINGIEIGKKVYLFNIFGNLVLEKKTKSNSMILNLSELAPGAYFIKIDNLINKIIITN